MLKIIVPGVELFDEITEEFTTRDEMIVTLEHSLVSLSKWESIFEKPFLVPGEKSVEEIIAYIQCMILSPEVDPEIVHKFSQENFEQINKYIDSKMTATWFREEKPSRNSETITSELIYYWMVALKIPFVAETWHLNRLFTLIRICNAKQGPEKKLSRSELAARNRELNERRKAELNTRG